jgi:hypothetical protein
VGPSEGYVRALSAPAPNRAVVREYPGTRGMLTRVIIVAAPSHPESSRLDSSREAREGGQ